MKARLILYHLIDSLLPCVKGSTVEITGLLWGLKDNTYKLFNMSWWHYLLCELFIFGIIYFCYFYLFVVIFIDLYTLSLFRFILLCVNLLTHRPSIRPRSSTGTRTPFANTMCPAPSKLAFYMPRPPRAAASSPWGSCKSSFLFLSGSSHTPHHSVNQEVHDGLVLLVAPSNWSERLTKPAPTETTGWAPERESEILSMKMQSTTS